MQGRAGWVHACLVGAGGVRVCARLHEQLRGLGGGDVDRPQERGGTGLAADRIRDGADTKITSSSDNNILNRATKSPGGGNRQTRERASQEDSIGGLWHHCNTVSLSVCCVRTASRGSTAAPASSSAAHASPQPLAAASWRGVTPSCDERASVFGMRCRWFSFTACARNQRIRRARRQEEEKEDEKRKGRERKGTDR